MSLQVKVLRQADHIRSARPAFLGLFLKLTLLLTFLVFAYLVELHYIGSSGVYANLWSPGPDRFGDFWHYRVLLEQLHQPAFFAARDRFAYPAPCAILFQVLYSLGSHPHVVFNLFLWAVEGLSAGLFCYALCRCGMALREAAPLVLFLVATSYPWHFLYDRGNIEIFVYTFIAAGVWAWLRGHHRLAALLWGVAASMKLYPILLLVLFFRRTQWTSALLGFACCFGILLFSFWYVGPSIQIAAMGTLAGVLGFVGHYGAHSRSAELVFDHSILGAVKEICELPTLSSRIHVDQFSRVYEGLVILVGPWAYLRWRRRMPALNQLCILLLALILLPPVSYDYTLIYMYLVLGIVFCCATEAARTGVPFQGARTYMTAFAFLCTTETWLEVHDMHPNGLIKCVALLMVAVNVARYPLRELGPFVADGAGSSEASSRIEYAR